MSVVLMVGSVCVSFICARVFHDSQNVWALDMYTNDDELCISKTIN